MALAHPPAVRPLKDSLLPHGRFLVERAMRERGLTVTGLALRLGISRKHLSNILGARVPLGSNLVGRLAETLDLCPEILAVLRHDGVVPRPLAAMSPMGIEIIGDPNEPIEGWFED
ncbi:MAG: transcriptional regulator [Geminicoccaceae bacterium]